MMKQEFAKLNPFALTRYSLAGKQLSCLYFTESLAHIQYLNLSKNQLIRFGRNFDSLVSLETLNLDENQIERIEKQVNLPELKYLYLQSNRKLAALFF